MGLLVSAEVVIGRAVIARGPLTALQDLVYIDALSSLILFIIGTVGLACSLYMRSYMDDQVARGVIAPGGLELDAWLRYVSALPSPFVDEYAELDLRLGWQALEGLELSLVGQNLLHESHAEFGPASPFREEVERSFYGKVVWRF